MGIILSLHHQAIGFLLLLWGLNGLFQSVGGPLSYATIFKWVPRSQRGRWMGTWNASHNIGGAVAGIFAFWGANMLFSGHVAGKGQLRLLTGYLALSVIYLVIR